MKLPAILTPIFDSSIKVLVYSDNRNKDNAVHIEGHHKGSTVNYNVDEATSDITHEYLSNTWGVVESKEHAEFIIELAELHGFDVGGYCESGDKYFYFDDNYLGFICSSRIANSCNERKITIPLPPKAKKWMPQVGDEVLICNLESDSRLIDFNDEVVDVLAVTKDKRGLVLTISHPLYGIGAAMFVGDHIKKPKSKQDLKIEELQTKLCNLNAVDNYILASEIVVGNVEGLSYGLSDFNIKDSAHEIWDENCGDFEDFLEIFIENHNITKKN